ncbi:MAG: gamma-glutamyl-gamma-aminobutyrate hydrolase family protein [Oscillospiraceae bacterium]|nr:gamma-glutamyl-gamma-aminobutyrate hydrolase family protein [Oscillospiraceae bacterium]
MKPVILIAPDDGFNPMFQAPHTIISGNYTKCVLEAGGIPLVAFDVNCAAEYASMADGLLLTGGASDIHAGNYGEIYKDGMMGPKHPLNELRDDMDFTLLRAFMAAGKPVLGIGRGLQIVNVAQGGSLYMDLLQMTGQDHEEKNHAILAEPDSFVSGYGAGEEVVSRHHQGIKELGRDLRVCAKSPDGLVEAIEHTALPVFAVQWHPEQSRTAADNKLFQRLVTLCKGGDR